MRKQTEKEVEKERNEKIQFIYTTSDMLGRFVNNVEQWNDEDLDHEVEELSSLLEENEL